MRYVCTQPLQPRPWGHADVTTWAGSSRVMLHLRLALCVHACACVCVCVWLWLWLLLCAWFVFDYVMIYRCQDAIRSVLVGVFSSCLATC